jgi:ABC-type uncharacterized transport system permease subunit
VLLALFIASAIAYGAATFAYGADAGEPAQSHAGPPPTQRWARPILALAALLHAAAIGAQCVHGDHPLKNIYLATSFGALVATIGYLGLSRGHRLSALGPVLAPVGLVGLTLGILFSGVPGGQLPAGGGIASAHVALASTGLAGFFLASGVAGLYLLMERRLRTKAFRPDASGGMSLRGLDRLHHRIVLLSTLVFTLAIVTGVLWILQAGGPGMLRGRAFELGASGVAWIASVSGLVARATLGLSGRRAALLTLVAFAAVVLVVVWYGVRS